MLALLWDGPRHASSLNTRQQTQAEGEATVHLTATLGAVANQRCAAPKTTKWLDRGLAISIV